MLSYDHAGNSLFPYHDESPAILKQC